MDDFVPFGSSAYLVMLGALIFGRSMDMLSTWIATPNLELEGNPIAKLLGWRWGLPVNFLFCVALAFWPLPAIILTTTSLLVAARNFQSAWLMRTMGEDTYREWHVQRIRETRITVYLACLAGNTLLTAAVGGAVVYFSAPNLLLFGIGVGIVAYAGAVAFYTLLAVFRLRRNELRNEQRRLRRLAPDAPAQPLTKVYFPEEAQGK
jgi:MFS family permease